MVILGEWLMLFSYHLNIKDMKNLITRFGVILGLGIVTLSSCKKSPLEEVVQEKASFTTFELAKDGKALTASGTTSTSTVTLSTVAGELYFTTKVIPKIQVYTQIGTTSSSTKTLVATYTNVALAASSSADVVVSSLGASVLPNNLTWGIKLNFPLNKLGSGLTNPTTGKTTGSTTVTVTARDASDAVLSEMVTTTGVYSIKLL